MNIEFFSVIWVMQPSNLFVMVLLSVNSCLAHSKALITVLLVSLYIYIFFHCQLKCLHYSTEKTKKNSNCL
uniref:Uncharacterized protein n=1 Tax=Rhizophora mucronata TaxID=61149 RepID=A0A2P2Q8Y4_RHIMU